MGYRGSFLWSGRVAAAASDRLPASSCLVFSCGPASGGEATVSTEGPLQWRGETTPSLSAGRPAAQVAGDFQAHSPPAVELVFCCVSLGRTLPTADKLGAGDGDYRPFLSRSVGPTRPSSGA